MTIEQLAEQTRLKSKSALFALLGLILSPLAVGAHTSSSPAGSVHSYVPFDYEKKRRDRPLPAGKRLADLNMGEPRTVRMIYFLPKDKPYRQEVVDAMKAVIGRVQTFYAEQMQTHGYGNLTFRFETDGQGEPVVHRLDGKHPASHYTEGPMDEIAEVFDLHKNVYSIVAENDGPSIGAGTRLGKNGGYAWLDEAYTDGETWYTANTAHEIGHAFGLHHDFRDDTYIMSYGYGGPDDRLSASAAEFLSVHPYFNPAIPIEAGQPPTVELISPTRYPAGSQSVSIQLKVSDPTGIHQVCLQTIAFIGLAWEVTACRGVSGKTDAVVEFDYDGVIPSSSWWWSPQTSLSNPAVHEIQIMAIDKAGNAEGATSRYETMWEFSLAEKSPNEIASLEAYSPSVHSLAFSPDGALLVFLYGRDDPTVRLWDVATQKPLATLDHGQSVAFSRDGTLAIGSRSDTRLWDVATRKKIATLKRGALLAVTFSSDGSLLAAASDDAIRLWDVATRKQVAMLDIDWVTSLAFSPDGTTLAFVSGGPDRTIQLWDVATQKPLATLDHGQLPQPTSLAFSPDGTTLATGHRAWHRTVALWDVETWEQVAVLEREGTGDVTSVAFSPDGALLASAGGISNNTVRLWDVRTRQEIVSFGHTDPFSSVAFSLDGATLAAGSEEAIILWDVSEWTDEQEITDSEQVIPETLTKVSGDGQQGPASTQLAEPFVVSVLDQDDSPLSEVAVTFSVAAGGGLLSSTTDANSCTIGSSTSSTTVTTDAEGQAATRLTLGSELGTNTVSATVEGLEPETFTATATEQARPHRLTKVCGEDQEGPAITQLAEPFVVSVVDEDNAAMAGVVVSFAVTAGGGTLSDTTTTTDANGRAATRLTLGIEAGINAVAATVEGLEPVTFTATAQESPFASLFDLFKSGKRVALPDHTQLLQNAPNPFNSQTVVAYFLPEPSLARLEIFSLTGQQVAILHQGPQQAGYHRLHWDGRDAAGRPVASGAYLYRLVTDEAVLTRKLILLR